MKKFYYLLCFCCASAMLLACTDDDDCGKDDPSAGGNEGNKPADVRKIKRIAEVYQNLPSDLIDFEYADNTVKGVSYDNIYGGTLFRLTVENGNVEVMSQGNKALSTLPLEQGKIVSGKCGIREADEIRFDYDSCYCSYENEYLKQMLVRNYYQTPYGSNNQPELYVTDKLYDFAFSDGYLMEEICSEDEEKESTKYSYTDEVRNDANIDLLIFIMEYLQGDLKEMFAEDDILCLRLCGLLGQPTKALPSEIVYSNSRYHSGATWNLSYTTDEEGYPTEIKIKEKDSGEETSLKIYYQ